MRAVRSKRVSQTLKECFWFLIFPLRPRFNVGNDKIFLTWCSSWDIQLWLCERERERAYFGRKIFVSGSSIFFSKVFKSLILQSRTWIIPAAILQHLHCEATRLHLSLPLFSHLVSDILWTHLDRKNKPATRNTKELNSSKNKSRACLIYTCNFCCNFSFLLHIDVNDCRCRCVYWRQHL